MTDYNYAAKFEQIIASAAVTTPDGARRIPFVMGSLMREIATKQDGDASAAQIQAKIQSGTDAKVRAADEAYSLYTLPHITGDDTTGAIRSANEKADAIVTGAANKGIYDSPQVRTALSLATAKFANKPVSMMINPTDMTITQPKRKTEVKVQSGSRFLHFLNAQNQNNDIMRISISGSTGAMHVGPDVPADSPEAIAAAMRYKTWLSFYALVNEPMIFLDTTSGTSAQLCANQFSLICPSPHLKVPVAFIGHWDAMPEVKVSADHPHSVSYSATFVVDHVEGGLDNILLGLLA